MLGYSPQELASIKFDEIVRCPAAHERWVSLIGVDAERVIELRHRGGHRVRASMSKSAMRRRDDTVALVTFHDRTRGVLGQPDTR